MRDIPGLLVLLAPACRSSRSARASRSAAGAPLPPVFGFVRASGSSDVAFLVHRTHSPPALRLPAVGLLLSSMVPTNLRCPSLVRCATNSVADVEVGSRCLLIPSDAASTQKATLQHRAINREFMNACYDALYLRRKVATGSRKECFRGFCSCSLTGRELFHAGF